jgi:imidazolonepropionase-like amidohydrolase
MILMEQSGLSKWDALASATTLPAGLLKQKWGLKVGDEASLVILAANPLEDLSNTQKIAQVIHHGKAVLPW